MIVRAIDPLDALAEAQLVGGAGVLELDLDLAGAARVPGLDRLQVREGLLRAGLDQLPSPNRRDLARRLDAETGLDRDRRQPRAEQVSSLRARGLVAGHEQHRAVPRPADGRMDPRLADERAVEPEVEVVLTRDRVVEHAEARPGHRVHPHEERRVAALLEEVRVLGPVVLDDELAVGVEQLRLERVERPLLAGAVAVHDDDLGRARRLRAAHGGVDLLGVELAALVVERQAAARLGALDDPGDALHVGDDVDAHGG